MLREGFIVLLATGDLNHGRTCLSAMSTTNQERPFRGTTPPAFHSNSSHTAGTKFDATE